MQQYAASHGSERSYRSVEGEYVGIYASMGEATNDVRDRLLNVTNQMNYIAVGNISQLEELKRIGKRSEQDHLLPAMIRAMENINLLIEDTGMLSRAAVRRQAGYPGRLV